MKTINKSIALLAGFLLIAPLYMSPAVAAIYLKMEPFRGKVTAEGFEKWIQIGSLALGVENSVPLSGGKSGATSVGPLVMTKLLDQTSPLFALAASEGRTFPIAEIVLANVGTDQIEPYYSIILENVIITQNDISTGGDRPIETISLRYGKIKRKFIPFDDRGVSRSPVESCWDVLNNRRC